jgi:hypothetical protein
VRPRRLDILLRRIDAGHLRPQPRQRLGEQPRAASDIRNPPPGERPPIILLRPKMHVDPLTQIAQPHRVQPVEHRRRSVRIPPIGGKPAEMLGLGGVDGGHGLSSVIPAQAGISLAFLHLKGKEMPAFAGMTPARTSSPNMARIVMKFGGTSMAGIERIRHVSNLVKREAEQGNEVAVVVSAMAGETDRLVQLCREAASLYDPREYDVVVASGEQVTSGLLAITLRAWASTRAPT